MELQNLESDLSEDPDCCKKAKHLQNLKRIKTQESKNQKNQKIKNLANIIICQAFIVAAEIAKVLAFVTSL